jgi:hypothetical protein
MPRSARQLDREIAQALGSRSHARVGGRSGGAHQAWDVSLNGRHIDTVFYAPGIDADQVRRGLINHDGYDPGIKVRRRARRGGEAHATKLTIPGIGKWSMYAGGTGAAEGKHSYDFKAGIKGEYHIFPFTTKYGRHAGYLLKYAVTGGQPRGSHSGLWHDLGKFRSPASAAKAAREHYERSFE